MRVVVAPDSLKGSVTAAEAASAIAAGWLEVRPDDEVVLAPMADGGEGTVSAVAAAIADADVRRSRVTGPGSARSQRDVDARWLLLPPTADQPRTALIELAEASGLLLLDAPAPLTAHTLGLGQLIREAISAGADRVLIALGGSGSTDGGAGALEGLGARLRDVHGDPVPLGNIGLGLLASIDFDSALAPPVAGAIVLSDVDNPLLGDRGAVAVFGPQKGMTAAQSPEAERVLAHFAELVASSATTASVEAPGAGAAGGTGFGMLAWGATITSGSRAIADTIGLAGAISGADLVITAEGRFDGQSAGGKAPVEVARLAAAAGVPCALVAGVIDAPAEGFAQSVALVTLAGSAEASLADPVEWLRRSGAALATAAGFGSVG